MTTYMIIRCFTSHFKKALKYANLDFLELEAPKESVCHHAFMHQDKL